MHSKHTSGLTARVRDYVSPKTVGRPWPCRPKANPSSAPAHALFSHCRAAQSREE